MAILDDIRHERFVHALLEGKNQGEAYIESGYTAKSLAVASAGATRLLKDAKILNRLNELRKTACFQVVLDRAWVLERLMRNARIAMGEESVKLKLKDNASDTAVELDVSDRNGNVANKALELLGKTPELAMFVERVEHGGVGDFDGLTDDQLRQFITHGTYSEGDSEEETPAARRTGSAGGKPH